MSRRVEQSQSIAYGRDVVKRLSVLIANSYPFDCHGLDKLAEARQMVKEIIADWQKLHNEVYNPRNLDLDMQVYDSDFDEDKQ